MRRPAWGETNLGALVGVVVGATGGLFSLGVGRAIIWHDPSLLLATPLLNVACLVLSGAVGWVGGGQLGPRCNQWLRSARGELVGGAVGGLVPVLFFTLLGWYLVAPR